MEPQATPSRESKPTRVYHVHHWAAGQIFQRPQAVNVNNTYMGITEIGVFGVGNRVILFFDYNLPDSVPPAPQDVLSFEIDLYPWWFWSAQSPNLYGSDIPGNVAFIWTNRPCLMDLRPTAHPSGNYATRLDMQWEPYYLPNNISEAHPFNRLGAAHKFCPAIVCTSPGELGCLRIWPNTRGGDLSPAPRIAAGGWLTISMAVCGLAGTF